MKEVPALKSLGTNYENFSLFMTGRCSYS